MKVLNFGSINIDYVYAMDHFVAPKETTACLSYATNIGGKGLNQSLACKKAGIDIIHAGKIGNDGLFILDYLKENNIDTSYIEVIKDRTGHAIIQTCKGENCIIIAGGSNQQIDKEYIDKVLNDFNKDDILIIQNEISNISYLIKEAYKKGLKIYFNIAPMDSNVFNYPLEYVDTILVNEVEGKALAEIDSNDYLDILSALENKFEKQAILMTVGKDGAYYSKNKERIYQSAYKVNTIDSTAAGDTFTGFFISSVVHNKTIKEAMNIASKASSITVQREGAAKSIPSWDEVINK